MKNKKHKYWVDICDSENLVLAFQNAESLLAHIEVNAPITCGTVLVPEATHRRLKREFKDGYVAVGLSWNRYAPQFGFKKV